MVAAFKCTRGLGRRFFCSNFFSKSCSCMSAGKNSFPWTVLWKIMSTRACVTARPYFFFSTKNSNADKQTSDESGRAHRLPQTLIARRNKQHTHKPHVLHHPIEAMRRELVFSRTLIKKQKNKSQSNLVNKTARQTHQLLAQKLPHSLFV